MEPDDEPEIPEAVRLEAFEAAIAAVRQVFGEHGCTTDDLLIYEFLDIELATIAAGLGAEPTHGLN